MVALQSGSTPNDIVQCLPAGGVFMCVFWEVCVHARHLHAPYSQPSVVYRRPDLAMESLASIFNQVVTMAALW